MEDGPLDGTRWDGTLVPWYNQPHIHFICSGYLLGIRYTQDTGGVV